MTEGKQTQAQTQAQAQVQKQPKPKKTRKKVVKAASKENYRTVPDIKIGDILVFPPWFEITEGEDLTHECEVEHTVNTKDGEQVYEARHVVQAGKIRLEARQLDQVVEVFVDPGDSNVVVIQ